MSNVKPLLSRKSLVSKICEIVDTSTLPPAEEMIAIGTILIRVGTLLRGQSTEASKQAIRDALKLLEKEA